MFSRSDSESYRCSQNTAAKQESFRHIVGKTFAIISAIRSIPPNSWARVHDPLYIDLFAGPGFDDQGNVGSPVIFAAIANRYLFPIEAHFYERDRQTAQRLASSLVTFQRTTYFIHVQDNEQISEILPTEPQPDRFGVVYADPSNADLGLIFDRFRQIEKVYPRVDLVLNYAAASWKRQNELDHYRDLISLVSQSGKQKWLIRKPIGNFQWSMLLGTNFLAYKAEEKQHWFDIESGYGHDLLRKIAFTRDENQNANQLRLF